MEITKDNFNSSNTFVNIWLQTNLFKPILQTSTVLKKNILGKILLVNLLLQRIIDSKWSKSLPICFNFPISRNAKNRCQIIELTAVNQNIDAIFRQPDDRVRMDNYNGNYDFVDDVSKGLVILGFILSKSHSYTNYKELLSQNVSSDNNEPSRNSTVSDLHFLRLRLNLFLTRC